MEKIIYSVIGKSSGFRSWLIEVWMYADNGRVSISKFSPDTEEQKQVLQEAVIFCVSEINLLAAGNALFSPSKTTCSIYATSCWVLKSKGTPLMLEVCGLRPIKSQMGQQGLVEFFFTATLRLIACNIRDKVVESEGTLFLTAGITLKICKVELA